MFQHAGMLVRAACIEHLMAANMRVPLDRHSTCDTHLKSNSDYIVVHKPFLTFCAQDHVTVWSFHLCSKVGFAENNCHETASLRRCLTQRRSAPQITYGPLDRWWMQPTPVQQARAKKSTLGNSKTQLHAHPDIVNGYQHQKYTTVNGPIHATVLGHHAMFQVSSQGEGGCMRPGIRSQPER